MAIKINSRFGSDIISKELNDKVNIIFGTNGVIDGMSIEQSKSSKTLTISNGHAIINGAIITNSEEVSIKLDELVSSDYVWKIVLEYQHEKRIVRFLRVVPNSYLSLLPTDIKASQITDDMILICEATGKKGAMEITVPKRVYTIKRLMTDMDKIVDSNENATPDKAGLMSAEDKKKLDSIEWYANKYVHPETHPASMITQSSSLKFVSDTEKSNWNNKINKADYTIDSVISSTQDVLAISKSGKYIGYQCINSPKRDCFFIYDIECYSNNGVLNKVITAYATDSTASYIRYRVNNSWTNWILIYDSITNKHDHGDIYFNKKEFLDLTTLDSTWKPGIVYDNVFTLPMGLIIQWGDTGNWPNMINTGSGWVNVSKWSGSKKGHQGGYQRSMKFHTPFKKFCNIFVATSPQSGAYGTTGGNGTYWEFDHPIILNQSLSEFTVFVNGNEGCFSGYEKGGIGLGMEWLAIGM